MLRKLLLYTPVANCRHRLLLFENQGLLELTGCQTATAHAHVTTP